MTQANQFTAFSIYTEYLTASTGLNTDRMLTSIIVRYLIPVLGGQAPKGKRATSDEIRNAIDYLKQVNPYRLSDAPKIVEEVLEQQGVSNKNRKTFRSILKNFIDWATNKGYLTIKEEESNFKKQDDKSIRRISPKGQPRRNWEKRNYHGFTTRRPFSLMAKYPSGEKLRQLIYPGDYINEKLASELKEFEIFRREKHNCSDGTIEKDLDHIHRILGWVHRYKEVPLEELSFTSLISFCNLNIQLKDCLNKKGKPDFNKHFVEKAIARQTATDKAKETLNLVSQYLEFLGGHPHSKIFAISTCITVAKFVFRNEMGTDDYPDELEIPVIRRLLQFCKTIKAQAKTTPPTVPYHQKSVSWEAALQALERLRILAKAPIVNANSDTTFDSPAVMDLQHFLSLAFMVLMPPDRARTYYELELGRTFVQGTYQTGAFIPKDKMTDPDQALWYIHLKPRDYKTGATYGEYWGHVPNIVFSDSTTFYEYIDKWLTQGREYLKRCNHNFFFRGVKTYQKVGTTWGSRIANLLDRETGIPVSPKEFRKMYVTFLKNSGATEAELEAAAYAMHHSRQMQSKIYDQQDKMAKIAPIFEFNERAIQKFFLSNSAV